MVRSVALPPSVRGALYLHSMPGWYEPYNRAKQEILGLKITRVVCLAPMEEVRGKSPNYAQAIEAGNTSWAQEVYPIADYDVPQDRHAFMDLSQTIAQALRLGERVLVHYDGGRSHTAQPIQPGPACLQVRDPWRRQQGRLPAHVGRHGDRLGERGWGLTLLP